MISIEFCNGESAVSFGNEDTENLCIENILTILCKKLKIRPLCQHIFGLRIIEAKNKKKSGSSLWLCLSKKISELQPSNCYQFRIRFMPPSSNVLRNLDPNSFKYLFYQVRHDFLSGHLPDHTQQPKDGLGLVVTDVVHHLLLNTDSEVGDLDIFTFMPKSLRSFPNKYNVKSTTENLFKKNHDTYIRRGPEYIRYEYLEMVEQIGRPTVFEKYSVELDEGNKCSQVDLFIDPFHPSHPGLYYQATKKVTEHLCTIEELVYVSIRKQDLTVVLSRENGIPCYFSFISLEVLESLVSCLTGYYRLMKRWTFDLCIELPSAYLHYLKSNKCHGPVGHEFVSRKLKTKGGGEQGIGILRASSLDYDVYKLSIMRKMDQPLNEFIILQTDNKVHFKDSKEMHDTLHGLIQWAKTTNFRDMGLKRLLPPFELETSHQMLIYASSKKLDPSSIISGPKVMLLEHFVVKNDVPLKGKFSRVYHVQWVGESGEQLAIKVPTIQSHEKERYMSNLNKFLFISGDCIVKIFGITLDPLSLVMEYLPLGPLDVYLKKHAKQMRQVDLVEAAAYLAKALWDLHSKRISHNNIRCRKVLVVDHTSQRFKVKLGDPGKIEYSSQDIHWVPREHLRHPASALTDPHADAWAFATTLWEIFSLGDLPLLDADLEQVMELYSKGFMLYRPSLCPKDLYRVMISCWHPDPHSRKQPQAIIRDVNQIFYYIFNSRRENQYQKMQLSYTNFETQLPEDDENDDLSIDIGEQLSVSTQKTDLTMSDGSTISQIDFEQVDGDFPHHFPEMMLSDLEMRESECPGEVAIKPMTLGELLVKPAIGDEEDEVTRPIVLSNCFIQVLNKIGKGNYGDVFKGKRTFRDQTSDFVALKRLRAVVGNPNDFKKEMEIMKNLRHENIVEFHCLAESEQDGQPSQFMVMEYLSLGSLQDYLLANKDVPRLTSDQKLLAFAMDIAKGMDYLESQQIIHRDLAARNVLVSSEDHVKITDFGLAQRPNQGHYYIVRTVREMPIRWYALESIELGKFSHKTDVWSYGVTLWEMFTRGLTPDLTHDGTVDIEKQIKALKNGKRLVCQGPCKTFIYTKLILPCWDQEPAMRPEFTKIMSTISELQEEMW